MSKKDKNEGNNIVILTTYQIIDLAEKNFDQLMQLAKDKKIKTEGMILIQNNAEDKVCVTETCDHLGRKGIGWGGNIGLLVGLAAPSLLESVAVGDAAEGLIGKFARKNMKIGIEEDFGNKLKPGTAAIISIVEEKDKLASEQALADSQAKLVAPIKGIKDLKEALAEAGGKFSPDRTVLPIPDRKFGGTVGRTLRDSVADWTMIPRPQAPEDAPNILVILIDDAGYGNIGSFGGPINTPNFTRVQEMGITYNRFHVTAICSPTRACLLTGRNQHRVGFGSITEYPGPFQGYTGIKPKSCAAYPRILKENGYVTGGFGKWHLTPSKVQGAAGPFDHWPQAWGFDHWWGFLGGDIGQYDPIITQDNSILGVPEGKNGEIYYFPDDLTDKAIEWLHAVRAQDVNKPWMIYYATGCAHSPHHVAKKWADKYKGQFDDGWDVLREKIIKSQKEMGIIPEDTELTERPDVFPAWDSLNEDEKKLYARQMEVYAGFSENADWNVGRLLDAIDEMGDLDNTLIFYIWGDNGASMEGTLTGSFNEMTFLRGIVLDAEQQLKLIEDYGGIDAIGGIHTAPHYAAAWAHAGNTPFQWGKQMASHLGGTRNPMVIAWPNKIKPDDEMRTQFTHCIDVGPTILEVAGIPEPKMVDGIEQEPMDGISFAYTFDNPDVDEHHTVQYFEMLGSRAIYKDGWWAASKPDRIPWDFSPETLQRFGPETDWNPDEDAPWELYYLPEDFSQAKDIAADNQDKVKELQDLWWDEADKNHVLPLMGGVSAMYGILPPMPTVTRSIFAGDVQNVLPGMIPRIYGRSYVIEAELLVPESGAKGVIVANADFLGGFSLWVDEKGLLHHTYSMLDVETYKQTSTEKIPTGDVKVKMLFKADKPKPGTGGKVTLFANEKKIGEGNMPQTVAVTFSLYAGMDIGRDNGLVVDRAYENKAPYKFTGTVKKVVFDLKPNTYEDEKELHEIEQQANIGHGASG